MKIGNISDTMRGASKLLSALMLVAASVAPVPAGAETYLPHLSGALHKATDEEIARFKADPLSLLRPYPAGGIALSESVKALIVADTSLIDDILTLSKQANNVQATAIGVGIGLAVKALRANDAASSGVIAAKVAEGADKYLLAGYNIAINGTFSSGGGGYAVAGGGGGIGISGGGGGGGGSTFGIRSYNPSVFFGASSLIGHSYGGAYISCTHSVSPYRKC